MGPSLSRKRERDNKLWLSLQAGRLDSGHSGLLVILRRVAGDADRADDLAGGIRDDDAALLRRELAFGAGDECCEEAGIVLEALRQREAADAHGERAIGLGQRDLGPEEIGAVLALHRLGVAGIVEHDHAEWLEIALPRESEPGID